MPTNTNASAIDSSERRERVARHAQDHVGHRVERARADRLAAVVEQQALARRTAARVALQAVFPERVAARDDRDDREVVRRRRRRRRPFERRRVPGIRARRVRRRAGSARRCTRKSSTPSANRNAPAVMTRFDRSPAEPARVGVDPPRHAEQAGDVHREEADVEADEHGPEAPLAESLVQHPAGEFREPVVDAADDGEHVDADQHVVEMGDDEVGVGQLPVDRHRRGHEAGDAADHEHDDEARRRTGTPS